MPARLVAAEIVAAGGRATYAHLDAASAADNERVAETAAVTYGTVDVLVTAAGISHAGYRSGDVEADAEMYLRRLAYLDRPGWDLVEADVDEIRRVMDVNLVGTLLAIQSCGQRMLAAGAKGSIVTIASVAAKLPDAGPLGYVLSKAAVWMLTKKAARMLAPAGIRVNAIGPGFIDTNMTAVLDLADESRGADPVGHPDGPPGRLRPTWPTRRSSSPATSPRTSRASSSIPTVAFTRTSGPPEPEGRVDVLSHRGVTASLARGCLAAHRRPGPPPRRTSASVDGRPTTHPRSTSASNHPSSPTTWRSNRPSRSPSRSFAATPAR